MQQTTRHHDGEDVADSAVQLLRIVRELAAELHPQRTAAGAVTLDSLLARELGFDSLAKVELIARIERHFSVSLPERVVADAETPRELLRALLSAGVARVARALPEAIPFVAAKAAAAPPEAQTLVEVLQWHVARHPDRIHIRFYSETDEGEAITYRQLWDGALRIAAGLQRRDVEAGEAAALMLPTCQEYFFSFFAILLLGAIPVPLYPPARPSQIEDHLRRHAGILANCRAATLITVPEARGIAQLLKSHVETLRHVVTVRELEESAEPARLAAAGPQDIALLQYTSGSTGHPKGVVLTHANLLANIRAMGAAIQADSSDIFVSWLPLYHDMGLIGAWLGSLTHAVTLVSMPPLDFLTHPRRWLWAIHRYRATLSAAPNFGYELCLRRIEDEDLKGLRLDSWRAAFNGAEAVSPDTMQRFQQRFKDCGLRAEALMPVYGLAECAVGLCFPPLGRGMRVDHIKRDVFMHSGVAEPADAGDAHVLRFAACGHVLADHQVRVVDRLDHELPERRVGQLQCCGPSCTSGYYRNPEQTAGLFSGAWLNSGDLAYLADGEVYITGRIKDMIIRAGRNIYPDELEAAIGDIPGIRKGRVAVFASSDPATASERLVVIAETRLTEPAELSRLRERINALAIDLAETSADEVVLAAPGAVLKTSSGKIRRAACRELYERGLIGKTPRSPRWQLARVMLGSLPPVLRRARHYLAVIAYSGYARALFWSIAPIVWTAVAVSPRLSWRWAAMRAGVRALARGSCTALKVHGRERLEDGARPCVFVANHASYLDGPIVIAALGRRFRFVAKAELLQGAVSRIFLQRIQAEFVERFDQQQSALDAQRLVQCVRAGNSLLFFPEGTFTRLAGLMPFHMGAFVAAAQAGVPVVPIAIRGARATLRGDGTHARHGAITVWIGAPIHPRDVRRDAAEDDWAIALKLRDAARRYILSHCGEPDLQRA
ncbi:MAG: AMP-binding protein [Pseudomonadota bacterium]